MVGRGAAVFYVGMDVRMMAVRLACPPLRWNGFFAFGRPGFFFCRGLLPSCKVLAWLPTASGTHGLFSQSRGTESNVRCEGVWKSDDFGRVDKGRQGLLFSFAL